MRPLHAVLIACSLAAAVGCSMLGKSPEPKPTTPIAKVNAEQLVSYLNERAARLQELSADVGMTARVGVLPANLKGNLEARQPKDFRMTAGGSVAGKVDLGSNFNQFWVYTEEPTHRPMFVYASYNDFESGRAKLPNNLPFEPEWVMQALGMHVFPTNLRYNAPTVNMSERTYTLSWQATTPAGMAVVKEVVFDADDSREGRPQVKKHLIRDTNKKLICSAEIKKVNTAQIAGFDQRAPQVAVQYPTHITLKWPQENFELELSLSNIQVNQRITEDQARALFTLPTNLGQPVDLAHAEWRNSR
jgi:hypothetical protein